MNGRWSIVGLALVWAAAAHADRPDLIISALEVPRALKQGRCNQFDVRVENLELAATSGRITVRLHLQFASGGEAQHIRVLNGIGGRGGRGAVQTVSFTDVAVPGSGQVSYAATVNPDGAVPETVIDERNSAAGSSNAAGSCP